MTKTIVVAVDAKMDNFATLGNVVEVGDYRVLIHTDPRMTHNEKGSFPNFDIFIDGGYGDEHWDQVLAPKSHVKLSRIPKDIQGVCLRNFATSRAKPDPNFLPIPTWVVGWNNRNYPNVTGKVVVKPKDGARGLGHFVVHAEHVNLDYFLKSLKTLLKSYDDKKLADDGVDRFLEQFRGNVQYFTGDEKSKHEGLEALSNQGYFVQSVVPAVSREWRILTDCQGRPVYFQQRRNRDDVEAVISDDEYQQATGGGSRVEYNSICTDPGTWFKTHVDVDRQFFTTLCQRIVGPMGSIDLFQTADGRWGVFEYCNQYGISGVPANMAYNLHYAFLVHVIELFLDVENPEDVIEVPKINQRTGFSLAL